jgi:uncharacterized membrane protein YphA (DoxX/SURF4 family)
VLRISEFSLLACRLLLAVVFLFAGATKLADPIGFRKALRDFGVPAGLARFMLVLLPLTELAVAAALVPASVAWYAACGALGLLGIFLMAVGVAMARGRKPDCNCFGQLHSAPVGRATLVRNGVLAACAGWIVWRGPAQSEPGIWAWLVGFDVTERKVALVVAGVAVFLFFRLLSRARPRSEAIEPEMLEEEEAPPQRATPARRKRPAPPPEPYIEPPSPGAMGIGLPVGTPAPEFELQGMNGEKRSLQSLREPGRDLCLVFSSPFCEPCQALAGEMVRWMRAEEGLPKMILISRGTPQENLAKLKGFDPSRVLLQAGFAVSDAYDCSATPTAVLVGADGLIRSGLAVGRVAIQQLLASAKRGNSESEREVAQG